MLGHAARWALRNIAHRTGRLQWAYRRFANPDGIEWAAFLKRWGGIHSMGSDCYILTDVTITDPQYLRIGDNVRMSGCALFGHDGSVNMINKARGLRLDHVGKIDVGSNVFIGYRAIVMPGVTIGDNVIIGAAAVITRDVPSNCVMVGVPAHPVCTFDSLVERLQATNNKTPQDHLISSEAETHNEASSLIKVFFTYAYVAFIATVLFFRDKIRDPLPERDFDPTVSREE